jgi:hypothetical protein
VNVLLASSKGYEYAVGHAAFTHCRPGLTFVVQFGLTALHVAVMGAGGTVTPDTLLHSTHPQQVLMAPAEYQELASAPLEHP